MKNKAERQKVQIVFYYFFRENLWEVNRLHTNSSDYCLSLKKFYKLFRYIKNIEFKISTSREVVNLDKFVT